MYYIVIIFLIRSHVADKKLFVLICRAITYYMVNMCLHFLGNLAVNIAVLFVEVANPIDTRPDICLVIKEQHA